MKTYKPILTALLLAAPACRATGKKMETTQPTVSVPQGGETEVAGERRGLRPDAAASIRREVQPETEHEGTELASATAESGQVPGMARGSKPPLFDRLWVDPVFKQRFTESYLALSELEPRVTLEERDTLQQVAALLAESRQDRAIALLIEEGGPQVSAVLDFTLGNIYFQTDELEQARAAYSAAVQKHMRFRRAWKNLGMVQFRLDHRQEAVEALTRVISLGGGDATTYGLLGFSYSALEKSVAAESAYRMAMLLDADTLDWKLGLARAFFEQRKFEDAMSLCGDLIAEQPDSADLWMLQGNAYIGMGQNLRAAENFEFIDKLGQSTQASLNNLGDIYVNEQVFELAVNAYIKAMQESPKHDTSRAMRATRTLSANGAHDEALRLIASIRSVAGERLQDSDRKELLKVEARIAVARGNSAAEAATLEKVVALDPMDGEALILLGQYAGRQGDVEKGIFYFERATNIDGFELQAKRRHGQLLVNNERYAEALPLLRRVQSLEPREALKAYIDQVERLSRMSGASR